MSGGVGANPFGPGSGYIGKASFLTGASALNILAFLIRQIISGEVFVAVVEVQSCSNAGGVSPVGVVSVEPMVGQVDGLGNIIPHKTIFNIPYFRLQGGANAIIMDPQQGDIGVAVFADRDISVVKSTKQPAAPGSRRTHDWADGLYFGGFLNGAPTQYIDFTGSGISVMTPGTFSVTAMGDIDLNSTAGNVNINGTNLTLTGALTNNGKNVGSTHEHSGVTGGPDDTGPPV